MNSKIRRIWTVPLTGAAGGLGVLPLAQHFADNGQVSLGIAFVLLCGGVAGSVAYFATPSLQRANRP